jgi:hypothetical protein
MPAATAQAVAASPSTLTVATGSVTGVNGTATPDTIVDLYAWPSDQVLKGLKGGATVPRKLIATATSNSAGKFSLEVSKETLSASAVSSGNANLEADAGSASWFFTVNAKNPAITSIHLTGVAVSESPDVCIGWQFVKEEPPQWATVGQAYIASNATHVVQSFTYSTGQSSTLGVGLSYTGKAGSFSADGTVSTSSSENMYFPSFSDSTLYRTLFTVGLYYTVCGHGGRGKNAGSDLRPGANYMVQSNGWFGAGETFEHPKTLPKATYCGPQPAGSGMSTNHERAVTWSTGFSIAVVGFGGQAQTGYDTSAQISLTFNAPRYLCGTNAIPAKAALLVVKK